MTQDSQETRWAAFGWNVISIPGNDMAAVDSALTLAKETKGKPTVIILNTTKGCGVSFMENLAVCTTRSWTTPSMRRPWPR